MKKVKNPVRLGISRYDQICRGSAYVEHGSYLRSSARTTILDSSGEDRRGFLGYKICLKKIVNKRK